MSSCEDRYAHQLAVHSDMPVSEVNFMTSEPDLDLDRVDLMLYVSVVF